jgi:predicted N-acetyltransferase YhbS
MDTKASVVIRPAQKDDLNAINAIIESCVMSWNLPERVKRLSLSSYRYGPYDLYHFDLVLAEITGGEIAGVAAWEPATPSDLPKDTTGMLLHGLYVAPPRQNQGIGRRLIDSALEAVRKQGMNGLLVKAQADAIGYFQSQDFASLTIENPKQDYPYRWWKFT